MSRKLVEGVGINDSEHPVVRYVKQESGKQKLVWFCPFYRKWVGMIQRCYNEKEIKRRPTYIDCVVCEEWLTFSNFKAWMEQQDWEGKHLDKDLLVEGNRVYSPHACAFITPETNRFLTDSSASRGELPIGVSWNKTANKYQSQGRVDNKPVCFGYFDTPEEAHFVWKKEKHKRAVVLASTETDPRVKRALETRFFSDA